MSRESFDLGEVEEDMRNRQEEWVEILRNLIQIPSVNPPGDTREIADYVTSLFEERDIPYERIAPKEEMPNIAAQFEGENHSQDSDPHLVFNGHLDTFPVRGEDQWEHDPFSGTIDDGKLHGLGAADMHGGFTASLAAYFYLYENRDRFAGTVTFTATSDEETGSEWGAEYLLDKYPEYRGDAMINGEPSSNGIIRFGGRGTIWLRITAQGESDHSAYPGGLNAIEEIYSLITELREEVAQLVNIPEQEYRVIRESEEKMDEAFGQGATDHVVKSQVNLNILQGGDQVNLTADTAEAEVDIRIPIATDGKKIIKKAESLAENSPADIDIELIHHTDPTFSDINDFLLQTVQKCAGQVRDGDQPGFSCGLGMTDGRFYRIHNVPTALYGPTPHNVGSPNEYIEIDDFIEIVATHAMSGAVYMTESPPQ